MWEEIVIVLGFVITALGYFGLTPKRMSRYAVAVKAELYKKELSQRMILLASTLSTVILVCFAVWFAYTPGELPSQSVLVLVFVVATIWRIGVRGGWRLSEKGKDTLNIAYTIIAVLLLIGILIVSDMPLWKKIVYPAGGAVVGHFAYRLKIHVDRKRKKKAPQ